MKRISKSKQKGLSKLPEDVVNKMGFTKKNMKAKYGTGKMLTEMKYGDMSLPMQARMRMGREVPMTSAAYGKMEMAKYGKSKKLPKAQYRFRMPFKDSIKDFYNKNLRSTVDSRIGSMLGSEAVDGFNTALRMLDDEFKRGGSKKARYGVSMQTPGKKKKRGKKK